MPSGAVEPGGELQITREFRISKAQFEKLAVYSTRRPDNDWEAALPARQALELAKASFDAGDGRYGIVIRELKLMLGPAGSSGSEKRALEYYFVGAVVN